MFLVFHIRRLIYCFSYRLIRYNINNNTIKRFSVININVHTVNSNIGSSVSSSLYVSSNVVTTVVVVLAFFILE